MTKAGPRRYKLLPRDNSVQAGWGSRTCTEANEHVMKVRQKAKGTLCPCCLQTCKLYRRAFTDEMARFLIDVYRSEPGEDGYVNINEIGYNYKGGDYAKARYWNLVELKPKDPADTKRRTSGRWRLTKLGKDFVLQQIRIPSHVLLYSKRLEGWDLTVQIDIVEALGEEFDYEQLMKAALRRSA